MTRKSFCSANGKLAHTSLLLAAILVFVARPASGAPSAPDWLVAAKQVDIGHLGDGEAAVIVGEWTEFDVDATGKFVETERRAIRVLNLRSATPFLRAESLENTDESVTSIRAWAITGAGRVVESQKKDIVTENAYPQFELFSDDRVKSLEVAGAEDGALVGYEIVRSGHLPIEGERFILEGPLPVRLSELHVSVPAGSLRYFVNHPERVEVVSQSPTAAVFRMENRPGIVEEEDMPPYASLAAAVFVNYDPKGNAAVQSWEDAGRSIHSLLSGAERAAPEIATQVETLSAGHADTVSKLNAVYTFVSQQVRYVAVEIGIGGFEPHAAADVYRNRYGDCKDKATLLLTMLDHIGLRGYPALVGTRRDVEADPQAPSLATFDHMIVALPVSADLEPAVKNFSSYDPKNHILWIDPTSEADPLGQLPEMDQGVFALISYPDHGDLQRIPESPAEQNGVVYQVSLRLDAQGNGAATVQEKYLGTTNTDRHYLYRARSRDQMRQMFEDRVAKYASQTTLQQASYGGEEDSSSQITEQFSFSGHFVTASAGDSWFFQPLFLSAYSVPEVGPEPRISPMELGTPHSLKGKYRIELPADMRFAAVPPATSLQTEFGSLDVTYSAAGNVLTAAETLSFTTSRIPVDKFEAFRNFLNASRRVAGLRLRVVKAGTP